MLELWREAEAPPSTTDSSRALTALLDRDREALLVAEQGGQLVGTLIAGWDGWRGNLYRLAVKPAHRRWGVARALVAEAERRLAQRGASRVSALVQAGPGAAEFWKAVGYQPDARTQRSVKTLDAPPRTEAE